MDKTTMIVGAVGLAAVCSGADAALVAGQALTIDMRSTVSVRFVSSDAGATGALYLTGWERGGAITAAVNSDATGLGAFLFTNRASAGDVVEIGDFEAGDVLNFAYTITSSPTWKAPAGAVYRSDAASTSWNFATDAGAAVGGATVTTLGVEDIKYSRFSDDDYNDAIFEVVVAPRIPSPGGAAIACVGLGVALSSRRRARSGG